jgi:DNA-binding NtrC family response regulator
MNPPETASGRILVVDDEWSIRDVLSSILRSEGYEVDTAEDGDKGIEMIDANNYDLVITDLKMPKVNGIEVLRHLSATNSQTLGIVATGYGSIESAVDALRLGAFDYITKPFHLDEIKILVHKAREFQALQSENRSLKRQLKNSARQDQIIGNSSGMRKLGDMIRTVGDSDSTVLILGESGTGKELVTRALHEHSDRADAPLIPVNCGAIPEDLLESELFGHVKGAFTGATMNRVGRFELANGGTIFLDEIGDMSPKLQVKLLRVLQEQAFEPVGATQTLKVNVRIIAATNRDLEQDVADGRFREDLYYRLNVIPIHIPPLRERRDDVPLLTQHFIDRLNKSKGRRLKGLSADAMGVLCAYNWPGNVRELENLIERMAILHADDEIGISHLPEKFQGLSPQTPGLSSGSIEIPDDGIDFNGLVDQFESDLINKALEKSGGVKNQAAQLLGIKRTTLVEKMKKKGMLEAV